MNPMVLEPRKVFMFSSVDLSPFIWIAPKYSVSNQESSLFWCHLLSQKGLYIFMIGNVILSPLFVFTMFK